MNKEIIISGLVGLIIGILVAPFFSFNMPMRFGGGMMMGGGIMNSSMMGGIYDDRAFIEEIIPHHQMAVMMARKLLRTTDRPEMQQLAENIIDTQTGEINQMREWYDLWYGN